MDYLHDGSFEGVLSGVYDMFYSKASPVADQLLPEKSYQLRLSVSHQILTTDREKASKVARSAMETFGEEGFKLILYAYLYEDESYGTMLYRFLKKAYKLGNNAIECLSDEDIFNLYKQYRAVARESHLMLGILRFAHLERNIYYAQYEPTYDLTGIVAPHFAERLKDQLWVIHDTKRGIGAFYDGSKWFISAIDEFDGLAYSESERDYQALWQAYFKHIAIQERRSIKRQMNFMPKKYWKFLTEKELEDKGGAK